MQRYFDDWKAALTAVLEGRYGAARAGELAEDAIARAQGAILLMEVTKDPAVLQRACRDTVALLDEALTASGTAAKDRSEPWKEAS